MIIETSAPTRVDLAGGTIDIPPLYLFHDGAATVNMAISLRAHCRIETRTDGAITLASVDRGVQYETSVERIPELRTESRLELLAKLVHFFKPETGFDMVTRSTAPAGAGLGGSSALNIACVAALNHLTGEKYPPAKFIEIAANIETTVIRVPAGYQDYYSAQYGGASCIHFRPDGIVREPLDVDLTALERRLAVCYTGEPRNSGTNNWDITKRHIDGDPELFDIFEGIRDTALEVRAALIEGDWDKIGRVLLAAHPERKRLSPHITTPQMDAVIETALKNGAIAPKVCGAGGGGCIAFFCQDGRRSDVEAAVAAVDGVEVLDWKPSPGGVTLTAS